jgi:hypothetical protein
MAASYRGRPRPSIPYTLGKFTKKLHVTFTAEQYLLLNELALYDTVPMSAVIRMACGDYIRKRNFMKRSEILRIRR